MRTPHSLDKAAQFIIGCQILRASTPPGETRTLDEIAWMTGSSLSTVTLIYNEGLAKAKGLLAGHNNKENNNE